MPSRRQATVEELHALTEDLRSVLTTATTDPRERARREWEWRVLYGGLSAVAALLARRLAMKTWGILTGERPPAKHEARTR
jgi:hypothetical protein